MKKEKVLCFIDSVGAQNYLHDYEKERKKGVFHAENVYDFLNKIELNMFSEIIFDYTRAHEILRIETGSKALKRKSEEGVIVKIICPATERDIKLKGLLRKRLVKEIPQIKEGLFI